MHEPMDNVTEKRPECFVAMWFGSDTDSVDEMDQLYELVIKPAIDSFNFEPYQVGKDDRANELFNDILNAIDRAYFVIADLTHPPETGLRGSVLFEAGYAFRSKPVIWMCREDVAEACTPFDAVQLRQIRWNKNRLKEAKEKLQDVIKARIIERGKQHADHELKRLFSETWKKIETAEDIHIQDDSVGGPTTFPADQVRFTYFEELCDDLKTRIDYKDMGLTQDDKYELIEMLRKWTKVVYKFAKETKGHPNLDIYKHFVLTELQATGWIDS